MKKSHKFQIVKKSDKIKKNISQTTDSGRSMVEMLGVLAVIGVLSVASILGYRFAMAKWRANETVNELNIRAYDIATRFDKLVASNTREIEMEMGNTTKLGYPIMARISPQYVDYFEMFVSNVPTDVCKELLNSQWQAPYSIFVGVEEYEASSDICEQAENVQLAYEFYKDLSTRDEIPEETRHKIQRCNHTNDCKCGECNTEHGLCESRCLTGQICVRDYNNGHQFVCCDAEKTIGEFCCRNETSNGLCCDDAYNCCPPDRPLRGDNGVCYACDSTEHIKMVKNPTGCNVCLNRKMSTNKTCSPACGIPGTVTADRPIMSHWGSCKSCINNITINSPDKCTCENHEVLRWGGLYSCMTCGVKGTVNEDKPLFDVNTGGCHSCDDPDPILQSGVESKYLCNNVCSNRILDGSNCKIGCPKETPLMDSDGSCHDCNYEKSIPINMVTGDCSTVCSNREVSTDGTKCSLKCGIPGTVTADRPIMSHWGSCKSCINNITINSPDKCTCENHEVLRWGGLYSCMTCGVKGTVNEDKPLFDVNTGGCHSCDDPDPILQSGVESKYLCHNVCSNRILNGSNCRMGCPKETPLMDSAGNCQDCNYKEDVSTAFLSDTCKNLCPNRETENNKCVRKSCSATERLEDVNGTCYPCNIAAPIPVGGDKTKCDKCIGRYMNGDYCVMDAD